MRGDNLKVVSLAQLVSPSVALPAELVSILSSTFQLNNFGPLRVKVGKENNHTVFCRHCSHLM